MEPNPYQSPEAQSQGQRFHWPLPTLSAEFRQAAAWGVTSAIVFWLLFIWAIFYFPDPQNAIALLFSPAYAVFVGALVAAILASIKCIRSPHPGVRAAAAFVLPVASLALASFLVWLASELATSR